MCNYLFNVCLPSRRKVLGRAEFTKVCLVHCWVHRVGAEWREVIFSTSKVKKKKQKTEAHGSSIQNLPKITENKLNI